MNKELTPCIQICKIEDSLCKGCYRTIEEIMQWQSLTRNDKLDIIDACERRKQQHDQ